jgi:nitric oxide dioxygenase
MTHTQIALVQSTFATLAPQADAVATLFYSRLFDLDPGLKRMFSSDMTGQGRKLTTMLALAVNSLNRLDELVPVVRSLGVRHAGYGVTDAHYDTVGSALLWTLEQGLGAGFTPDVREAWTSVYGVLATTMKSAAAAAA